MTLAQVSEPNLLLFENDFVELSRLAKLHAAAPVAHFLGHELDRAHIVTRTNKRVVRLGSRVLYHDLSKSVATEITLVLPREADLRQRLVSVLTPVGAALIGLEEGQRISFSMPWTGIRTLAVVKVSADRPALHSPC
jgi:regulator of nucleoside diphosphate kinase